MSEIIMYINKFMFLPVFIVAIVVAIITVLIYLIYNYKRLRKFDKLIDKAQSENRFDYINSLTDFLDFGEISIDYTMDERIQVMHKMIEYREKKYKLYAVFSIIGIIFLGLILYHILSSNVTKVQQKEPVKQVVVAASPEKFSIKDSLTTIASTNTVQHSKMKEVLLRLKQSKLPEFQKDTIRIKLRNWLEIHQYTLQWLKEDSLLFARGKISEREMKIRIESAKKQQDSLYALTAKINEKINK